MSSVADPSDWIERGARDYPDRLFLAMPAGRRYNYADLRGESGRVAAALQGLGVQVGDRVAVRVEKSAQAVLLYVACLRLGAAFVPINVACSPNEVEYFLTDSKARVAVVDPADLALLGPVATQAAVEHLVTLGADGCGSLTDLVERSAAILESERNVRPDSLAAIVYTSGTTGRSKGAMLTRANLASNATVLADSWRFTGHQPSQLSCVDLLTLPRRAPTTERRASRRTSQSWIRGRGCGSHGCFRIGVSKRAGGAGTTTYQPRFILSPANF